MTDWKTHQLGELIEDGGGRIQTGPFGSQLHASDYVDDPAGIPCIMPANMHNNRVDLSSIARISRADADRLSRHLVQEGDLVYSRRGDVTQKALIHEGEDGYFCGTGCLLVRPGGKIDPAFLTYYLSTKTYQRWIEKQAVGATMPNLNTGILERVSFTAPDDKDTQHRIAKVLSTLDAKIELNNRINEELEGLAKLLYDYWFVQFDFPISAAQAAAMGDPALEGKPYRQSGGKMVYNPTLKREIPEAWEAGTIESLGHVVGGSTPSTKAAENFHPSGTPWITPKDLSNNGGKRFIGRGELFVSDQGIKSASLRLHPEGTVLMSSRAPVGYLAIAENPVTTNQGFKSIIPSLAGSSDYVFETLRTYMPVIKANASGSTFKEISGGTLKQVKIPVPTPSIVQDYSQRVSSFTVQIFNHQKQNQELAALRDWLLPMLMNGQVTVG